jgi:hypothetical protein
MITPLTARKLKCQWQRAYDARPKPVELTKEQQEAARLGFPDLTPEEAEFYVYQSERYVYDVQRWSRDEICEDPEELADYERMLKRERDREERAQFGGRARRAMERSRAAQWRTNYARQQRNEEEPPF